MMLAQHNGLVAFRFKLQQSLDRVSLFACLRLSVTRCSARVFTGHLRYPDLHEAKMANSMEMLVQVDPDRRLLRVRYEGKFSLVEAQDTFHEILNALVQHKLRKVLIDGREISGDPEPLERFYYGKFAADAVSQAVNRGRIEVPRFAYILKEPILDPNRFGETVAVNRGMRVKTFDDAKQAEWWLGIAGSK